VGFQVGKLGEKVFVNAAEDISGDALEFFGVEGAQELAENSVVKFLILALG
jgi:hypothetical protein